jgi:hypothetical protein
MGAVNSYMFVHSLKVVDFCYLFQYYTELVETSQEDGITAVAVVACVGLMQLQAADTVRNN